MKKLKIHPKFRKRRYDEIFVPEIRLEGKWLEELGFECGGMVKVEWKKGKLIITTI